jgi:hypothetical protein
MAVRYLDDGNDEGTVLGQSTSAKIGFYGLATPIVQPTVTGTTTTTATTTALQADLNAIGQVLENLGLINYVP